MILKSSDIPGLREAIKRENDVRDAAFLNLHADICGVKIRQMTPRDLLILDGIGNSLMGGGLPSHLELADFLWKLSPGYRRKAPIRRYLFGRSIRKLDYLETVKTSLKYITDTFQDSPASSGIGQSQYASWCAYLVNNFAIHYGWTDERVMGTPLKILFQLLKCIRRHNNPECPMHNPSDKVKGDFIRLQHARKELIQLLKKRN